ncbi:MAG: integrase domain-containing protein [Cellvibrio sp.]|nr:integrase domain-containing protein [Cellvibrio sp.]
MKYKLVKEESTREELELRELGFLAIERTAANRGGRYGWCVTTKMRWGLFCNFCSDNNICKTFEVNDDVFRRYAKDRLSNRSVATAQNYLSSVNTVMKILVKNWISISPKKIIGKSRCSVRNEPILFSVNKIESVVLNLNLQGLEVLSGVVLLAANFGLRRREASLLDICAAAKEAKTKGVIDIFAGTKGGRGRVVARLIPCHKNQILILETLQKILKNRKCLIPEGMNLKKFYQLISNKCLPLLQRFGIERLHDLRAYYACERYQEITGCSPPCNRKNEDDIPCVELDESARKIISSELGHTRIEIVSSYIGRKPRRRQYER